MKKSFMLNLLFFIGSAALNAKLDTDALIQAAYRGDAVELTNLLQENNITSQNASEFQGTLHNSLAVSCLEAAALGTLARGFNILGRTLTADSIVQQDPLLIQVLTALNAKIEDIGGCIAATLYRGYNILGYITDGQSIRTDSMFEYDDVSVVGETLSVIKAAECKAALFSLDVVTQKKHHKKLPSSTSFTDQIVVQDLMQSCIDGNCLQLDQLLSDTNDLVAALQSDVDNATIKVNAQSNLSLNCLEAAIIGTLKRGYNALGLVLTAQGIILDAKMHDILKTLARHGIDLQGLELHCQR